MFFRHKFKSGFTLIELLVVMALIGVLATAIIAIFDPKAQIGKVNDAKRKADLTQLQRALEMYYQDNGRYPASTGTYTITGSTGWGGSWTTYMEKLPIDPTSSVRTYVYFTPNSGACSNFQCYYLFANLERGGQDPQACKPGTGNPCDSAAANGLADACGGATYRCTYGLSSPNVTP